MYYNLFSVKSVFFWESRHKGTRAATLARWIACMADVNIMLSELAIHIIERPSFLGVLKE